MPPSQPATPGYPKSRRGAISLSEGQNIVDYFKQLDQAQELERVSKKRKREASVQHTQQGGVGAEAPAKEDKA